MKTANFLLICLSVNNSFLAVALLFEFLKAYLRYV